MQVHERRCHSKDTLPFTSQASNLIDSDSDSDDDVPIEDSLLVKPQNYLNASSEYGRSQINI